METLKKRRRLFSGSPPPPPPPCVVKIHPSAVDTARSFHTWQRGAYHQAVRATLQLPEREREKKKNPCICNSVWSCDHVSTSATLAASRPLPPSLPPSVLPSAGCIEKAPGRGKVSRWSQAGPPAGGADRGSLRACGAGFCQGVAGGRCSQGGPTVNRRT